MVFGPSPADSKYDRADGRDSFAYGGVSDRHAWRGRQPRRRSGAYLRVLSDRVPTPTPRQPGSLLLEGMSRREQEKGSARVRLPGVREACRNHEAGQARPALLLETVWRTPPHEGPSCPD